ncbi:hypothetical protein MAR_020917 [Mya arenaria]|uniref:Uncharacterized protein n=1 Tax=Mya arenaria TaxID=6604 RepID=A0ABY7E6D7_MYAAR|nr:hypothetical protein MAR_020917 [Mya arenaria]
MATGVFITQKSSTNLALSGLSLQPIESVQNLGHILLKPSEGERDLFPYRVPRPLPSSLISTPSPTPSQQQSTPTATCAGQALGTWKQNLNDQSTSRSVDVSQNSSSLSELEMSLGGVGLCPFWCYLISVTIRKQHQHADGESRVIHESFSTVGGSRRYVRSSKPRVDSMSPTGSRRRDKLETSIQYND